MSTGFNRDIAKPAHNIGRDFGLKHFFSAPITFKADQYCYKKDCTGEGGGLRFFVHNKCHNCFQSGKTFAVAAHQIALTIFWQNTK